MNNKIINIKNFTDYFIEDKYLNKTPDLTRISFIGQHIRYDTKICWRIAI